MAMHIDHHTISRRRFLSGSASTIGGAIGWGTVGNILLPGGDSHASDYKALVCISLSGGNDGSNMIVPVDADRYAAYAAIRQGLAIPKSSLLRLDGTEFGLHPALGSLRSAWVAGEMSAVLNVGPLPRNMSKAELTNGRGAYPGQLYSHVDQQALWECGGTDSFTKEGWGGRASDAIGTANPVISLSGNPRFGISGRRASLTLPEPGMDFSAALVQGSFVNSPTYRTRRFALDAMYSNANQVGALARSFVKIQQESFGTSDRLAAILKSTPGTDAANAAIDTAFANVISNGKLTTGLAKQLYQVAKLIANNLQVQGNRQIFYTQLDGFDTHGNQVVAGAPTTGAHAKLLTELGDALGAFQNSMRALGLHKQVTAFTQSDFGRTFKPNNSLGTDHGWGNHQLVVGGAVNGGRTYGAYPELTLGGPNDVGSAAHEQHGRWIPHVSVDQYAATLINWFGVNSNQLFAALPNLANFSSNPIIGFL